MTVSFQGQITAIGPAIAKGYAVGDIAQLYVECAIQGSRGLLDDAGKWPALYSIDPLGISNQSLGWLSFDWIWVTSKQWLFKKTLPLCPMPDQAIKGTFVLSVGNEIVQMGVSQSLAVAYPIVLDSKNFTIPVKESSISTIPWKQIGMGLGIVGAVSLVVAIVRR